MLRSAALLIGFIALVTLVSGATLAGWHTLPFAVPFGLLVVGLLLERFVYKPTVSGDPGPGWERTKERFVDPRSSQEVVVYYNPRTGGRRYVAVEGET